MNKKRVQNVLTAIAMGLVVSAIATANWTAPLNTPPTCLAGQAGCDPPINVNNSDQIKAGGLTVGGPFIAANSAYFATLAGRVGIGTSNPAATNRLQVQGRIQANTGDVCTSLGGPSGKCLSRSVVHTNENLRIVHGSLGCGIPDGTNGCGLGNGYTITRPSAGDYTITFAPCFSGWPVVTVTPVSGLNGDIIKIKDLGTSNCSVDLKSKNIDPNATATGYLTDANVTGFRFIAIGPE